MSDPDDLLEVQAAFALLTQVAHVPADTEYADLDLEQWFELSDLQQCGSMGVLLGVFHRLLIDHKRADPSFDVEQWLSRLALRCTEQAMS